MYSILLRFGFLRRGLLRFGLAGAILAAALPGLAGPAGAVVIVRGGLADGAAAFDDLAANTFGYSGSEIWGGLPEGGVGVLRIFERTITRTNGSPVVVHGYAVVGATPPTFASGQMVYLDPPGTTDVAAARFNSGVTIASDRPLLAFGIEVGDWGTCCQPSRLYMALDGGAPIVVAETLTPGDQFLTAGGAALFIGLFGDGTPFSTIEFWHDGSVDFVTVGGAMHYVAVPDIPAPVPAPASAALLGAGLIPAFAAVRDKRRAPRRNLARH